MDGDIIIREARLEDIDEIVRQRRRMCEDMGERNQAALNAKQASTSTFLETALPAGTFRGWLGEMREGRVVAGSGMLIVPWLSRPCRSRAAARVDSQRVHRSGVPPARYCAPADAGHDRLLPTEGVSVGVAALERRRPSALRIARL